MRKSNGKTRTITALMKHTLSMDPFMKFKRAAILVKRSFPGSKFNERHLSWYKSALKRGVLKGVR